MTLSISILSLRVNNGLPGKCDIFSHSHKFDYRKRLQWWLVWKWCHRGFTVVRPNLCPPQWPGHWDLCLGNAQLASRWLDPRVRSWGMDGMVTFQIGSYLITYLLQYVQRATWRMYFNIWIKLSFQATVTLRKTTGSSPSWPTTHEWWPTNYFFAEGEYITSMSMFAGVGLDGFTMETNVREYDHILGNGGNQMPPATGQRMLFISGELHWYINWQQVTRVRLYFDTC